MHSQSSNLFTNSVASSLVLSATNVLSTVLILHCCCPVLLNAPKHAVASCLLTMVMSSQGVRTYVAGNSPAPDVLVQEGKLHNETWSYYPDDAPLRSLYGGDTRAALVPYLAHASFGDTYKWLLYGDDDTVWFMESVMKLLQDFDPNLPYFITGWFHTVGFTQLVIHGLTCKITCRFCQLFWLYDSMITRC